MPRAKIRQLGLFVAFSCAAFVTISASESGGPTNDNDGLSILTIGVGVTTTTTTTTPPSTTVPPTTTLAPSTTFATTIVPPTSTAPATTTPPAPSTTIPPPTSTAVIPSTTERAVAVASELPGSTIAIGERGTGVVVSPTGIALPIIGGQAGAWIVRTPCGNEATIGVGQTVDSVDIVLDAGHGGSEPGSVGPNGLVEKEVNLAVARLVADHLRADGYSVLLARNSDVRIPIRSRAEIARSVRPKAFVSIHHNGGAVVASSTPGTEVFYQASSAEARRLGGILYEEIFAAMGQFGSNFVATSKRGVSTRLNGDGDDLYGIHRFTPDVPSVITEALYISNGPEAELLARADVQAAEARAIAMGILRWLRTSDPGSGFNEPFFDPGASGTGGFGSCTDPALT